MRAAMASQQDVKIDLMPTSTQNTPDVALDITQGVESKESSFSHTLLRSINVSRAIFNTMLFAV